MTTDLEVLQKKVSFWLHWIAITVTTVILVFVLTLIYWVVEPDPVTVKVYKTSDSECHDRQFSFERYVQSSKAVDIFVQQRWHNLNDGNFKGIEKEVVITEPGYYPLGADFEKIMEFAKCVPDKITQGNYEYRPWATYQVNPIKTIHKLLPVQNVNVVCSFDQSKHVPCKPQRSVK